MCDDTRATVKVLRTDPIFVAVHVRHIDIMQPISRIERRDPSDKLSLAPPVSDVGRIVGLDVLDDIYQHSTLFPQQSLSVSVNLPIEISPTVVNGTLDHLIHHDTVPGATVHVFVVVVIDYSQQGLETEILTSAVYVRVLPLEATREFLEFR